MENDSLVCEGIHDLRITKSLCDDAPNMIVIHNWDWFFWGHSLPNGTELEVSLSFVILFRLLCFKLYSNISVINITNTYHCVYFFFQTNLLFYLNYLIVGEREKQANQGIISLSRAGMQHKTKILITFNRNGLISILAGT